jgi:hypothetical protein
MQTTKAVEVQRKMVVRTKSGSLNKPGASDMVDQWQVIWPVHARRSRPPGHLARTCGLAIIMDVARVGSQSLVAPQNEAKGSGSPLNNVL